MKKKILHIQLLPLLSGPQNVMLHILNGLDPQEYDIYVASKPGGMMVDEVKRKGYTYIPIPLFKQALSIIDIVIFIQLFLIFRKHRFDIVHTHSSKPGFLGRIAARLAGIPLIIHTGHGAPFHPGQPRYVQLAYMLLEKFAALFCDKLIFVNHSHRLFYIKHHLISPHKAVTIYNSLSHDLLTQIESMPMKQPDPDGRITIGSILRFSEQKNIVMTIGAAIQICRARNDVDFIFVGDGEYFKLCNMMVVNNHLQDRIQLPGWQKEPVNWLCRFDAFILYSIYEGLPMCIIEAMHAALPVIGSDIPTIAELVDKENGWLIASEQSETLVNELHKIIDAKDYYKQMGLMGKNKVRELCSYESFISNHVSIYRGKDN